MAPRAASSRTKTAGLTQTRLDFKAGRSSFTTKPAGKTEKRAQSTFSSSSSSSNDKTESEERPGRGFRPVSKRRKLDEYSGASVSTSEDATPDPVGEEEKVVRPKLDVRDKKYVKQYVETRRRMGNLEPIHPDGLNKVHHILRMFDLSYEYGPCVGVTRLERWERAHALGLNPPPEIKEILMTQEAHDDDSYKQNVFHGYEV